MDSDFELITVKPDPDSVIPSVDVSLLQENSEIQNDMENEAEEDESNKYNAEQFQENDGHSFLSGHFMFPTESTSEIEKKEATIIGKPVVICFHCKKYFNSQIQIARHCKIHHFCKYCNIQFHDYDEFYIHNLEIHTSLEHCKLCNVEFTQLQDRYEHVGTHTYVMGYNYTDNYNKNVQVNNEIEFVSTNENNDICEIFNCDICNEEINYKEIHLCPGTICIACNLKFESEEEFVNHIEEIHICKNICNHCYHHVRSAEGYINHIKICQALQSTILKNITFVKKSEEARRSNPKKYKCKYCFELYSKLKMEKHLIQNHQCLHCTKTFETQESLVLHLLCRPTINRGVKKDNSCQICNRYFKTKKLLNYHFRKYHLSDTKESFINCDVCREKILNTRDCKYRHDLKCRIVQRKNENDEEKKN